MFGNRYKISLFYVLIIMALYFLINKKIKHSFHDFLMIKIGIYLVMK